MSTALIPASQPSGLIPVFVLDNEFVARVTAWGAELGIPRIEGETSLRYGLRLQRASRLPAPTAIAGLLA